MPRELAAQPHRAMRARPSILLRAMLVAAALLPALGGAAPAATGFQATVRGHNPKTQPCPEPESFCGTADIADYGTATWASTITGVTLQGRCDSYEATVTFALADGSTLVLAEAGTICGPGNSNQSHASGRSFGHPGFATATWTVQSATGQFTGLTGGGTDVLRLAGADVAGAYTTGP